MIEPASAVLFSWGAAQTGLAIAVPILGAVATLIVWFHRRINNLEDMDEQRKGAGQFFGDSDSPLSIGLAREVRDLKRQNEETREDLTKVQKEVEQVNDKLNRIYDKINDED